MAISMILDPTQVDAEKRQLQSIVESLGGKFPSVKWQYSGYSNERFPLRLSASALRGNGPNADEILVIAISWSHPRIGDVDRLIVGAEILDEDSVILAESPKFEISMTSEDVEQNSQFCITEDASRETNTAMLNIGEWLKSQSTKISEALAQVA